MGPLTNAAGRCNSRSWASCGCSWGTVAAAGAAAGLLGMLKTPQNSRKTAISGSWDSYGCCWGSSWAAGASFSDFGQGDRNPSRRPQTGGFYHRKLILVTLGPSRSHFRGLASCCCWSQNTVKQLFPAPGAPCGCCCGSVRPLLGQRPEKPEKSETDHGPWGSTLGPSMSHLLAISCCSALGHWHSSKAKRLLLWLPLLLQAGAAAGCCCCSRRGSCYGCG